MTGNIYLQVFVCQGSDVRRTRVCLCVKGQTSDGREFRGAGAVPPVPGHPAQATTAGGRSALTLDVLTTFSARASGSKSGHYPCHPARYPQAEAAGRRAGPAVRNTPPFTSWPGLGGRPAPRGSPVSPAGSFAGLASEVFGVGLGRGVVRDCGGAWRGVVRVLTNEHL
jgi:hypothetical protein